MSNASKDRNPVDVLAEEFAACLRRGEHPSLKEFIDRYPEHADDIRELFPALALVEQFKPTPQDHEPSLVAPLQVSRNAHPSHLGDYRIIRYLGEGGMGVVYEAVRESLHSHVALKVMHPQFRNRPNYLRRFRTEARSAAKLHHTNIVSVFDYGVHEGICYYAMQYIGGQSLDKVLEEIRRLRLEKDVPPTGDTATLACHMDHGSEQDDVAGREKPRCDDDDERQTVALGLLTGRFATPGADLDSGEQNTQPPSAATIASIPEAAEFSPANDAFLEERCRAESTSPPSRKRHATSGNAPDSETISQGASSSSLTGTSDVRYYREVARIGAQVAAALAHAHQRGVLHRDIKPPNLILDSLGSVWVTDFGLAKFEDGNDLSQSQDFVGTLRYMAPERFRGLSDRRCDIYALGATLYNLLTLRPAFEGEDQLELIHRIENDPPVPPRQHDSRIPRDLETIVLKALAKDPAQRFDTALELAAELHRFLENRPIISRPISYPQQFRLWCKRNPWLATANISAAVLTTVLTIVSIVAALIYRDRNQQSVEASRRIQKAERKTREQLFEALYDRARAGRSSHKMGQRFDSLDAVRSASAIATDLNLPRGRLDLLRDEAIACMALPDLTKTGRAITKPAGVMLVTFDPTITRYALRFRDGTIQVRRVADDQEIDRFQTPPDRDIFLFHFSPDARYVATTGSGLLVVRHVERRAYSVQDSPRLSYGIAASFSPDSLRIAVGIDNGELVVYDLATGQAQRRQRLPSAPRDLAFRADGTQIAVVHDDQATSTCQILATETGQLGRAITLPTRASRVAWSPDGSAIATACEDSRIYVWATATGVRKASLDGHTTPGLRTAFDASGALLVSNDWGDRLRIWDPVLGRQWLTLKGGGYEPSRDGRIVVQIEEKLTTFQVDPALEYRTLVHAASPPLNYARVSIHRDGRLLALGTDRGVVLWDLVRGNELAYLPIGRAWHTTFDPTGHLLTNGSLGVWRWPLEFSSDWTACQIGPPQRLALPGSNAGLEHDRTGQVVAVANVSDANVLTPDQRYSVGPLEDCRGEAVSPDGKWLATGTHSRVHGVQVWRVSDGTNVKDLPVDYATGVRFSPDGKWLMTLESPCRLWSVGTWEAAREIGGFGHCFSPDAHEVLVQDANMTVRLVETETARTLASFESPDACQVGFATFSPDGASLVFSTNDGPAVHVWDLRAVRKRLTAMGLDWDAPPYSENDSAGTSVTNLPTVNVDYGPLGTAIERYNSHFELDAVPPEDLLARCTERLKAHPNDPDVLHQRGHSLLRLRRFDQALADFSAASALRPLDVHFRAYRGVCLYFLKRYAPALDQLEAAFQSDPETVHSIATLQRKLNDLAWMLATGPSAQRDPALATRVAAFSVALAPEELFTLNTLGVSLYRTGKFASAITTLEKSLDANRGQFAAYDLFFLAMAHHRLGQHGKARACFDRAVRSLEEHRSLPARDAKQLAEFRTEAEAVLAGPSDELPADVFAKP